MGPIIDHNSVDHNSALGAALLSHARAAIAEKLHVAAPAALEHIALDQPGASFVTLTRHGELRGCIGQLEVSRSLRLDVRDNALGAAFRDPRFPPLTQSEWADIAIEVSLLGPVTFSPCSREADCIASITAGKDGVILASGDRRATFLPQVWETLPRAADFVAQLKLKAGIREAWPANMTLGRYQVTKFAEQSLDGSV
ncbi:MAG TPA: AmmeMemoRadiSam system protein A [Rhodocyclaceae bacterium]|nr:AmmeMemoRadiSam system protein A [Rhodocyclaceae bacterium]